MATTPDYDSIIASLESALSKGVLSVRDGDMSFTFRSTGELMEAIAYWRSQKSAAQSTPLTHTVIAFERP